MDGAVAQWKSFFLVCLRPMFNYCYCKTANKIKYRNTVFILNSSPVK